MQYITLQVTFLQTVFNISKEGAEAYRRLEVAGIVSKYDSPSLAPPPLTL